MPTITESIITTGQVLPESPISDTDYVVVEWVILASTDNGSVVTLTGSNHEVVVHGSISGGPAIRLGDALTDTNNRLVVSAKGDVQAAFTAVALNGSNSEIVNRGDIWSETNGVFLYGSGEITNSGEIRSNSVGVQVFALVDASGPSSIVNSGMISGWSYGVYTAGEVGETVRVTNSDGGVIAAGLAGYNSLYGGGFTKDLVINRGLMVGIVDLGDGNDRFDNIGGRVQRGSISGSQGDDRFLPGSTAEVIDGGADGDGFDIDTLDFRSGGGLRVSLVDADGSNNTGRAKNDVYSEIERVWGSASGADIVIGDGLNNQLAGFGGADALKGLAGNDALEGGAGLDTLHGGAGGDDFKFQRPDQGGDVILDFDSEDTLMIDASDFGGGLAAATATNAQFDVQLNNVAQTATVRFIWESDSERLWFDRNGSTSGGLFLVADLQNGAVVTREDILLV